MPRKPKTAEPQAPPVDPPSAYELQVVPAEAIWQCSDTGHNLTLDQHLFVRSYIIDRNPVAALKRLHHDGDVTRLKRIADKYLAETEVQDAIAELARRLMAKLEITAEHINRRLASVAFFDLREVVQFDHNGMTMLNSRLWSEDQIAAVQSVEMGKEGIKLKLYDGLRATEMLAKQLSMLPNETAEAAAAASKAAAEAVMDRIMDVFERRVPDDTPKAELPPPEALH